VPSSLWPFSRLSLIVAFLGHSQFDFIRFSLTGFHANAQAWYYQDYFLAHILIAAWWLGLLFFLCGYLRKWQRQKSQTRVWSNFGKLAAYACLF